MLRHTWPNEEEEVDPREEDGTLVCNVGTLYNPIDNMRYSNCNFSRFAINCRHD